MSETVPIGSSSNESKPVEIQESLNDIEGASVPLMDTEIHGSTMLEWDLFWGFSVDYDVKCSGVMSRIMYNIFCKDII